MITQKQLKRAAHLAMALSTMSAEIEREMSEGGEAITLEEIQEIAEMSAELYDILND